MSKDDTQSKRVRLGISGRNLTGEGAEDGRSTILRLFAYARPFTTQLILIAILVMMSTAGLLAGPILLS
jgi:hypothetical protein